MTSGGGFAVAAPDADLVVRSRDGVFFRVHRNNLQMHSEGFPGEDVQTNSEIVELSESAQTLELLFQYMYRQPQPDLSQVSFEVLAGLAEAVQKYRVFPAMEVCKMYMSMMLPSHPIEVLGYAARHEISNLYNEAAPLTIETPLAMALVNLGETNALRWALYREQWLDVLKVVYADTGVVMHKGGFDTCENWVPFRAEVMSSFGTKLSNLKEVARIFREHKHTLDRCTHCEIRAKRWQSRIDERVSCVRQFSEFLGTAENV